MKQMKENEVKPCPFCGGEAEIRDCTVYLDKAVLIECGNCLVKTKRILINHPSYTQRNVPQPDESTRYTREQAIAKATEIWNRRATNESNIAID